MHRLLLALVLATIPLVAGEVTLPDVNLAYKAPVGWSATVMKPGQLRLTSLSGQAWINAEVGDATTADVLDELIRRLSDALKEPVPAVRSVHRMADGTRARIAVIDGIEANKAVSYVVAVWSGQGIVYNCITFTLRTDAAKVARRAQVLIDGARLIGDRPEWTSRLRGAPTPVALAGGLATVTLPQPRWSETSPDSMDDLRGGIDAARFVWAHGGAWLTLTVERSLRAESLLADLDDIARTFTKGGPSERSERGGLTWVTSRATGDDDRILTGTVVAGDGVCVSVMVHGEAVRVQEARADLDACVSTVRFHAGAADCAWIAADLTGRQPLPAALRRLFHGPQTHDAPGLLSPDGRRRFFLAESGSWLGDADGGSRQQVEIPTVPGETSAAVWSPDGSRLCWIAGGRVVAARSAPWHADQLTDGVPVLADPAYLGNTVLAVAWDVPRTYTDGRVMVASRIVRVTDDGTLTTMWSRPLAALHALCTSADGRWLAVRCQTTGRPSSDDDLDQTTTVYAVPIDAAGTVGEPCRVADGGHPLGWSRGILIWRGMRGDVQAWDPATGRSTLLVGLLDSGPAMVTWRLAGDALVADVFGYRLATHDAGTWSIPLERLRADPPGSMPPAVDDHAWTLVERDLAAVLPGPVATVQPDAPMMERLADALSTSVRLRLGVSAPVASEGLTRLPELIRQLRAGDGERSARLLALGAFHGECLRRSGQATWSIAPLPFGAWMPAKPAIEGNALVRVVLPFSAVFFESAASEDSHITYQRDEKPDVRQVLLVYPPAMASQVRDAATGPDYAAAWSRAATDPPAALAALGTLMAKHPQATLLLTEALHLAEATGAPTDPLIDHALAAGCIVPDILHRRALSLRTDDPQRARRLLAAACGSSPWIDHDIFVDYGDMLEAMGRIDHARSCWRQALRRHWRDQAGCAARFARTGTRITEAADAVTAQGGATKATQAEAATGSATRGSTVPAPAPEIMP